MKKSFLPYVFGTVMAIVGMTSSKAQSAWTKVKELSEDTTVSKSLENLGYKVSNTVLYSYNAKPDSTLVMINAYKGKDQYGIPQQGTSLFSYGLNQNKFDTLSIGRMRWTDKNDMQNALEVRFGPSQTDITKGFKPATHEPAIDPKNRFAASKAYLIE